MKTRNPYIQTIKYVLVSASGSFFITALITNLLGDHFEAALAFNWIVATYLYTIYRPPTFHYLVTLAQALIMGAVVLAVSLAPLWLFCYLMKIFLQESCKIQEISPTIFLAINAIVASTYILKGFRKNGDNPAENFM